VLSKEEGTGNKISLIFAVKDKSGALFGVLNEFAKQNIISDDGDFDGIKEIERIPF